MDAYLDFMTSVMRFWMNWMGSVMRFGMNAMTEPLTPSPNVVIRTSASPDRQADAPRRHRTGVARPAADAPRRHRTRAPDRRDAPRAPDIGVVQPAGGDRALGRREGGPSA